VSRRLRWLVGVGLGTLGLGVPVGLAATPARANATICVGIVVDYGDARPGSGPNSFCATVPTGASGADVLAARARALGRPQPTYRSDGLLCTIDGYPDDGSCGEPAPGGGYRYWSYWHKFPGSSGWTYSAAGATGFTVSAGLLEGWAFQNGGPERGRQPPAVSYSSVCRAAASPSPSHSRSPSPSARPAPGPSTASPTIHTSPVPTAQRVASASARPPSASSPAGASTSAAATAVGTASRPPPDEANPSISTEPSVTPLSAAKPTRRSPARFPLATLAGLLLAAAIGGAAFRRSRSGRN